MADPEGFAAMGCIETLLHGQDIANGLGLRLNPPRSVCSRVLARMFPEAVAGLTGTDPWEALQWPLAASNYPGIRNDIDGAGTAPPWMNNPEAAIRSVSAPGSLHAESAPSVAAEPFSAGHLAIRFT